MPSHLLYGAGDRWWLSTQEDGRTYDQIIDASGTVLAVNWPHRELCVFRELSVGSFQRINNDFDGYHWGPSGDFVVHVVDDSSGNDLAITDVASGAQLPLLVSENTARDPRWSPILGDGTTRIAFEYKSNIWTIDPVTQESAALHLKPSSGAFLMEPQWAPDGAYVVFKEQNLRRSGNIDIFIRLLPAGGSRNHVDLSAGLDKSIHQGPIAWVSDDYAP